MHGKCTLSKEDLGKVKWYRNINLVCPSHPMSLQYFRSETSIKQEQERHLHLNKYAIHPFSKFKAWYDVFLIYLYFSGLITKPIDAALMNTVFVETHRFYCYYTMIVDCLYWSNIVIHFFTGYEVPLKKMFEVRSKYIIRKYLLSPYFFIDVVSSFPKSALYYLPKSYNRKIALGVVSLCGMIKIVRLSSLIVCMKKIAVYYRLKSMAKLFIMCSMLSCVIIAHWMACLQFYIPKLIRRTFNQLKSDKCWFMIGGAKSIHTKPFITQYIHACFKSSAYMLGIRMHLYTRLMPEEYLLALFTYLVGKLLIAFVWIILAVTIINSRLMNIKFAEKMNQLEEYMTQKKLPTALQNKIVQYFTFKFGSKYFKEELITNLISHNLRIETNLHTCRSLIRNVGLFAKLSPAEVSKILECLESEIFLPNDTIIRAGTYGDSMYFLFSGTVAMYTRSGKEVCHLQDGAYFGEISLIFRNQLRLTTVVALETSHVYRLKRQDFERSLFKNGEVKEKLLDKAEEKFTKLMEIEEEYKQHLFAESHKEIVSSSNTTTSKKRK